jgi:oligopeptide transport system substrate-binding protein
LREQHYALGLAKPLECGSPLPLFAGFGVRQPSAAFRVGENPVTSAGFSYLRLGISRLFFLLTLVLPALTGCLRHEPRADIVIVNGAEPESLDPAIASGQPDQRVVRNLFEGLTRLDPQTAAPKPALAERWDISPDGITYTFHLRSNAVWSTGEPITAEDVIFSWRRIIAPATACEYSGQLFFVKNAEQIATNGITDITRLGVRALNPHTVQVELVSPTPFFLDLCAFFTLAVVPRQAIEKHGDRWLMTRPLPVSGTHLLESWRINDKVRLRKNPRHWDAANIRNEVVDILPIEAPMTALNLYETGQADIIWDKGLIPSELMDTLIKRPDCHTFDYLGSYFIRFNVTRAPLNDARVRKALALVCEKRRIVERITRAGERVSSAFTPYGTANYQPPEGLGYDPVQARRLLAEAGFANGAGFPTLRYLFNTSKVNEQIGVELQQMWKKELGVNIELQQQEWKVYLASQSALNYDLSRSSWVGDYNDANTFLDLFMSNNGNNRTGWKNPQYDRLIRQANSLVDVKKRAELLARAETLLVREDLPIAPLFSYKGVTFFDSTKVDGIYFNIVDEHPLYAIGRKDRPSAKNQSRAQVNNL